MKRASGPGIGGMNPPAGAIAPLYALIFGLSLALAVACGAEGPNPPPGKPAVMTVTNRSQFTLLELRMHGTASYATAPNLLAVPLTINATISHRGSGEYYVTTFRERFAGGPTVALTTETPISLADDHRYQLSVFDTSFRLEER